MADLLPSTPDVSAAEEADPRVIGVDSEDADDLLSALSSDTSRALLSALHDEPANPAALADRVDTSLQNAQYHLSNLEDAGLIDVVDTAYSEKGREMNVYAPSDRPLVVYAGKEEETSGLKAALSRLLGALSALALASVVVEQLFGTRGVGSYFSFGAAGGDDGAPSGGGDGSGDGADGGGDGVETVAEEGDAADATPTPTEEADAATPGAATDTTVGTEEPVTTETPVAETATPARDTPTETYEPQADTVSDTATELFDATPTPEAVDAATGLSPGLLFFLGGATVLAIWVVWSYRS